jgi:hypothetical protein
LCFSLCTAKKAVGLDAVVYKLVGDGSAAPTLSGNKGGNRTYRLQILQEIIPRFIEVQRQSLLL